MHLRINNTLGKVMAKECRLLPRAWIYCVWGIVSQPRGVVEDRRGQIPPLHLNGALFRHHPHSLCQDTTALASGDWGGGRLRRRRWLRVNACTRCRKQHLAGLGKGRGVLQQRPSCSHASRQCGAPVHGQG